MKGFNSGLCEPKSEHSGFLKKLPNISTNRATISFSLNFLFLYLCPASLFHICHNEIYLKLENFMHKQYDNSYFVNADFFTVLQVLSLHGP